MIRHFKQIAKQWLQARGYHLTWVNPQRRTTGFAFEYDLRRIVNSTAPVCLDVGANEGQTIRLLNRVFQNPMIYAFEPSPGCFASLSSRFQSDHVKLYNVAMGDSANTLELNEYSHSTLNSFLPLSASYENPFSAIHRQSTVKVPVTTIDDFIMENKISSVNLLKIDTQGFDLRVLQGSKASLRNGSISSVLIELNFLEMYTGQASATEILQFLSSYELFLVDLYEKEFRGGVLGWCTAMFSRRDPHKPQL